ncbi:GTP 3',8-cyclase [Paenibacillus baekrokdamisoli]|uniref:GTP 3',8-cyclase n=1 Tax=Paenibacillus baekrokdamisoli TaxID=1712516 RepID=A0A3G9IRM1_9BACL|nr:GTP 3',8-cyclase MoaA [Paenibacillus baekrokdamisoli]MBB3071099.1 cyclic pyranopterin phosphate synthase [Paenibacillus baekrokdamisoli]BBH21517.1 GTP 3',8-cyclase [Paenibacillus baekrokdamisoli]
MTKLTDRFGREHDYLRISVTDRCNLRCLYCMPEEGMEFAPSSDLLSYGQIVEVVKAGAELGISKLRITGGEPLVRPGLDGLVRRLAAIPGIRDISLTTNGVLLADQAEALRDAGVNRVNISLDTLDPSRFKFIARRGDLKRVMAGIEASARVGFGPIKLNCVLLKGVNEDEIADFLRMAYEQPLHVRFIEYMPIGHADDNWKAHYLPLSHVLEIAQEQRLEVERIEDMLGNGPSEDYQIRGGKGSFGLIHPISDNFCKNCNRLRLTADGNIKPCLYWVDELSVKSALGNPTALRELYLRAMDIKPLNHEMAAKLLDENLSHEPTARRMSQIGG